MTPMRRPTSSARVACSAARARVAVRDERDLALEEREPALLLAVVEVLAAAGGHGRTSPARRRRRPGTRPCRRRATRRRGPPSAHRRGRDRRGTRAPARPGSRRRRRGSASPGPSPPAPRPARRRRARARTPPWPPPTRRGRAPRVPPRGCAASRRRDARPARGSSSDGSWLRISRLQLAQLERRLEAEIVVQPAAEVLVDRERVGVPAAAVEREHRLPAQALAQREPGDLGRQLARPAPRGGPPSGPPRRGPRGRPGAARRGGCARACAKGSANSASASPRQSPSASRSRARGGRGLARLERRVARAAQPIEAADVDRLRIDLDEVAGRAGHEHPVRQHLAQLRDEDLHHLRRRVRAPARPTGRRRGGRPRPSGWARRAAGPATPAA